MESQNERGNARSLAAVGLLHAVNMAEALSLQGEYHAVMTGPRESDRAAYNKIREQIAAIESKGVLARIAAASKLSMLQRDLGQFEIEQKWEDTYSNVVTDEGARYLLDNGLAGSAYTAAFYMGLISSTGYTGVPVAANTMASHATWTEDSAYSQGARVTCAWSAAATRTKSLSSALTFTMNATTTIKGSFITTNSTKGGTTGTLYSAGLFTGGDQPAASGNTLTVSYSTSV